jgi:predicted anti-sigma-YlaC factor YlaD
MKKITLLLSLTILLLSTGCSKMILNKVSDALSSTESSSTVMMGDNDPEFMGDALPLVLKMHEMLLESNPEHIGLHRATASGFAAYSYAFIQFPVDTLDDTHNDYKKAQYKRAKKMYLRARNYGLKGLELKYPNFRKGLAKNSDSTLALTELEDIDLLYWTGLSWMGAFLLDKFDMKLALSTPQAKALLFKVAELDSEYGNGSIDEFLISFYGAMPKSMGGDKEKAKYHFDRALKLTNENSAGAYIAYAIAISIPAQNLEEFRTLMKKAAKIKPENDKKNELLRTIKQAEAKWYLAHEEDFFLVD